MSSFFECGFSFQAHELNGDISKHGLWEITYATICVNMKCKSMWSLTVIKKHLALLRHSSQHGSSPWSHCSQCVAWKNWNAHYYQWNSQLWWLHEVWAKNKFSFLYFVNYIQYWSIKIRVGPKSFWPHINSYQSLCCPQFFLLKVVEKKSSYLGFVYIVNTWHVCGWHFVGWVHIIDFRR